MARSILRRAAAWKATEDARGAARRRRRRAAPAIHHEAETTLAASSLPHIRARGSPRRAGFLSRAPQTREGAGTAPMARSPPPPPVTRTTLTLHLSVVPPHAETAARSR